MVKTDLLKFQWSIRMGKKGDLSDFECGLVVGARQFWAFQKLVTYWDFHVQPSLGFKGERSEKEKISSEQQFSGRKCLVDVRGQRTMDRLVWADRKATATQRKENGKACLAQHVEPWKQMSYSSRKKKPRPGNWSSNLDGITKIGH